MPETIILELKATVDPQTRQGLPARDESYRLKLLLKDLLRAYGFRCVRIRTGDENQSMKPPVEETE